MAIDLTGLTPYREASRKTLEAAFPGGQAGYDEEALSREVQKKLWGTGGSTGIYSQFAGRGLTEQQPETQYATSRVVKESMQDLLNQYQNRQIAAMNAARTAELTEPAFRLEESMLTGELGGQPTLAKQQLDIDRMLREAGLTGMYGGAPTLAARQLEQQAGLTREEFGLRRDLTAQQIQADAARQGRQIDFETAQAEATRQLQREGLAQQATLTREQLASQERLAGLQRELQLELQKGDLASREKIAQLQADIQREQLALQRGVALGTIGETPTLQNVLGQRELDIRGQEAATRSKQLEEELNWRQNMLLGGMAGSLAERSGLMDWLFGSQGGRAGGTGTGGTGGTGGVVGGVLNTAAKKAWDLITGAATSAPYLSTAPLSAEAAQIASQLVAQGIPQNIAYEAANATAVEGLSPAGESISNYLADFYGGDLFAGGSEFGSPGSPIFSGYTDEFLGPGGYGSESDPWVWVSDSVYNNLFQPMSEFGSGVWDVGSDAVSSVWDTVSGIFGW